MIIRFLNEFLSYLVIFPSALVCYLPVRSRLRYSRAKLAGAILLFYMIFVSAASLVTVVTGISGNLLLFLILIIFFFAYNHSIYVNFFCAFTLFINSCSLMSILSNLTSMFNESRSLGNAYDWSSGLFQFGISTLLMLFLVRPLYTKGSRLIEQVDDSRIWKRASWIPLLILLENILISPFYCHVPLFALSSLPYLFALLILLFMQLLSYWVFNSICMGVIHLSQTNQQLHLMNVQKKQYEIQQRYIRETSHIRHDFRQSIFTLQRLVENNDLSAIREYINEYVQLLPESSASQYCLNPALNSLLGFYAGLFRESSIQMDWKINLSNIRGISEVDLCTLLGNLLENVNDGCKTLPASKRSHILRINIPGDDNLFISSVNTFNGVVKFSKNRYLTTKKHGTGIGLYSIWITAKKYHGSVSYSHTSQEFRTDIYMKLTDSPSSEESLKSSSH